MLRATSLQFVFRAFACVAMAAATLHADAQTETWATRLGYPADAKVIVLHAHRMGLCHESNAAIGSLFDAGVVSSASAMPPCPWFADAAAWRDEHPDLDVGLELTINSPLPRYRWRPLGSDNYVASLLDRDGMFWRNSTQIMVSANAEQVEHELRMQILHADRHGLRPTHFTTYMGALFSRPDLAEVYLRLSREQWIPAVVIDLTPELVERFRRDGFPVPDDMMQTLEDYPFPKVSDLRIVPPAESLEEKAEATAELLATLPAGLTQVAFAPATDSPALRAMDPDWQQRVWDAEVWQDKTVQAELSKPEVIVTNWKEIMRRFDGSN